MSAAPTVGFLYVPPAINTLRDLSRFDRDLLAKVTGLAKGARGCIAGNEWLASALACSERSISRGLRRLIAKGYLKSEMAPCRRVSGGRVRHLRLGEQAPGGVDTCGETSRRGVDTCGETSPTKCLDLQARGVDTCGETHEESTKREQQAEYAPARVRVHEADPALPPALPAAVDPTKLEELLARAPECVPSAPAPNLPPASAASASLQIISGGKGRESVTTSGPHPKPAAPATPVPAGPDGETLLRGCGVDPLVAANLAEQHPLSRLRDVCELAALKNWSAPMIVACFTRGYDREEENRRKLAKARGIRETPPPKQPPHPDAGPAPAVDDGFQRYLRGEETPEDRARADAQCAFLREAMGTLFPEGKKGLNRPPPAPPPAAWKEKSVVPAQNPEDAAEAAATELIELQALLLKFPELEKRAHYQAKVAALEAVIGAQP